MKHQQVKAFTAQETDQLAQIHIHYLLLELHLDMTTIHHKRPLRLKHQQIRNMKFLQIKTY